ncbi:MAG TPA: type II toxin-antitoxin system MqsA family antitoxin [Chitinophagaceae bacterium]|nr:type II toxin-antitoxin system MqsA family antitoxin [Chitinophagaceae bacterium]
MKCIVCKNGDTEKKKVNFTGTQQGYFLVVKDVEADVCNNCGEIYYTSENMNFIEAKIKEALKNSEKVEILKF